MKARVNLTIDRAVLGRARRVARRQGTSVSGMVEKYLHTLDTADRPDGEALVRKWAGKLTLAPLDSDERRARLWRKYGLDRPTGEEAPPCKS
jgi:hypothetical protein